MERSRYCNKCKSEVTKSDLEEYSYQCMNCDEDLYEFETSLQKECKSK